MEESERAFEHGVAKYFAPAEEREGGSRKDLWAESKVNNYNMVSHFFWSAAKGRSPLPVYM